MGRELPAFVLQDRLRALQKLNAESITANEIAEFYIVTPDEQPNPMPDLSTPEGQAEADRLIQDAEFVVIDNISCLCRTGEENEADSWIPVQNWLLRLRTQGKSVLLVHHAGKGIDGSPRGTSKREDVLDAVISLNLPKGYKGEEGCKFELKFRKCRHRRNAAEMQEMLYTYTDFGWQWQELELTNDTKIKQKFDLGVTQKEIAIELGLSRSYVARVLRDYNSVYSLLMW